MQDTGRKRRNRDESKVHLEILNETEFLKKEVFDELSNSDGR